VIISCLNQGIETSVLAKHAGKYTSFYKLLLKAQRRGDELTCTPHTYTCTHTQTHTHTQADAPCFKVHLSS